MSFNHFKRRVLKTRDVTKGWTDEDFLIFLETCCHWNRSDFQIKNIKCIRFLVSVGTVWLSGCLSTKIANMICWMHWINIPASVYYMKAFIWPNVPGICTSFCLIRCWENTTLKVEDTCSGLFYEIHYEYAFFDNSIVIICRCLFCS